MAIDGLFLHFMRSELAAFAVGAKIDKIYFPTKYELVLTLRTRTQSKRLFISVAGNAPRINFTDSSPENPATPPMICMLFRKLLCGATVETIRQYGCDRVLFLDLNATNEIGDRVKRTLAVEIMGPYSNCILLNEDGIIIDALKRVDASKSSFREILPQKPYRLPPPQDKLLLSEADTAAILSRLRLTDSKPLSSALVAAISGCSPLLGKELAYRVCLRDPLVSELSEPHWQRLTAELDGLRDMLVRDAPQPCYLMGQNGELLDFYYMPLTLYANQARVIPAAELSPVLDLFFVEREKRQRAKSKAEDLFKTVNALIERTSKKINNQREELLSGDALEEKRKFAELINANIYALSKGASVYEVPDYYNENEPVRIPVSPELSPAGNAQKYFKEYRKAQTAKKVLADQIEKGTADLDYLHTVRFALENASTFGELTEIRAELSQNGFLKSKTGTKNKKNSTVPPLEFHSPDGFRILVGRNNLQNELLTFKKARKTDYWFHAKKAPGSHVILEADEKTPSETAMETAARLAAWYSSLRERGMVEVDYTQVKNIKKPPAARTGYVIYHVYNTMYVKATKPNE